jgi:hypothetical protein
MSEEMRAELRAWIRENLVIETSYSGCEGNDINISIGFSDEAEGFCSATVYLP